jgi:hypothetical protein
MPELYNFLIATDERQLYKYPLLRINPQQVAVNLPKTLLLSS